MVDTITAISAARAGNGAACEDLYNATSHRMLGLARSMLKNEEDALDILQESYLYAFKSLDKLEHPQYFETWLYRIVVNRCKNHLTRTRPKLFALSLTDEEGEALEIEDEAASLQPAAQVEDTETKRIVREMVEELPEDQRVCVLLFYYQEMKVHEIAALLDVSEGTVKSRLNYARKKLRVQAEEHERRGTILHGISIFPLIGPAMEAFTTQGSAAGISSVLSGVLEGLGLAGGGAAAAAGAGTTAAAAGTTAAAAETAATAATAAATGAAASGASTAGATFFGTLAGKIAVGVTAAAVVAGSGYALLRDTPEPPPEPEPVVSVAAPEPIPEPVPEPEPEPEPVSAFVFDEKFPDQKGSQPLEEYHIRVKIGGDVEIYDFDLETGDIYLGAEPGGEIRVHYTDPIRANMGGPHPWEGDDGVLEYVETDDYDEKGALFRVVGEGSGMMGRWGNGVSIGGIGANEPGGVSVQIHVSVPGRPPEPEPEPEPEPAPEPAGPGYILDAVFPDQRGNMPVEEYNIRVQLQGEIEVYSYDTKTGDIYLGAEVGAEFRLISTRTGPFSRGAPPEWVGDPNVVLRKDADGDPGARYTVTGEGSGVIETWAVGAGGSINDNGIELRLHLSVPGQPPKAAADNMFPVSAQILDVDGVSPFPVTWAGVELEDYYVIVLNDVSMPYTGEPYSESIARTPPYEVLTPAQAEGLGLIRDLSYTESTISFFCDADRYMIYTLHSGNVSEGFGMSRRTEENNFVVQHHLTGDQSSIHVKYRY